MAQVKNFRSDQVAMRNKLHIESGDHFSMQLDVDGYCVTLRFSPAPVPDIWQKIRDILISNLALDISENARDNSIGREPACTLKTEDCHTKKSSREKKVRKQNE